MRRRCNDSCREDGDKDGDGDVYCEDEDEDHELRRRVGVTTRKDSDGYLIRDDD